MVDVSEFCYYQCFCLIWYSLWNVRNADALIEVLEAWMPLLPQWMFQNILDQLVNPKLQMEVDRWNPLTDTVPIHAWLHPWLPLMGKLYV